MALLAACSSFFRNAVDATLLLIGLAQTKFLTLYQRDIVNPAGELRAFSCRMWDRVPYNELSVSAEMAADHENQLNQVASRDVHAANAIATLSGRPLLSNSGIPLDLNWIQNFRVNTSAVDRRAQSQTARRTVKKEWQAAWLLRAISCMDLTTLSGDDTDERVRRLCAKARHPLQHELVAKLGIEQLNLHVGAVCVYHSFIETAVHALEGSGIPVAAVSTGFPAGLSPLAERVAEIRRSVEAGAREIDIVITRAHVFAH